MTGQRIPDRGDVYWIDPHPVQGHGHEDRHRFIVISPKEINRLGLAITVAVTSNGEGASENGLVVPFTGRSMDGFAVCNMVRSFDMHSRHAEYIETLGSSMLEEIVTRVVSIIDPAE